MSGLVLLFKCFFFFFKEKTAIKQFSKTKCELKIFFFCPQKSLVSRSNRLPKWSFWTDFGQLLANLQNVDRPGLAQIWASLAAGEVKPVQETEVMNPRWSLNDGNSKKQYIQQQELYIYSYSFLKINAIAVKTKSDLIFLAYFLAMITTCPSSFLLRPLGASWQSTSTIISRLRTHWQTKCCDRVCCQMLQIRPVPRWNGTDEAMMAVRR